MKTILITGSTDGIGLATARKLLERGHRVVLHGRSAAKLEAAQDALAPVGTRPDGLLADLSDLAQVAAMADRVPPLDVLINNAGVFATPHPTTAAGLDVRFVVNTLSPILLTRRVLDRLGPGARIVNLSSAAQAPVDLEALRGNSTLEAFQAYSQSKLALTAWSRHLAAKLGPDGPIVVAVNPGSMLSTKMVREGFGSPGRDLTIGADILVSAALDDAFGAASGRYFDNDEGRFSSPHPAALDDERTQALMAAIDALLPASPTP